MARKPPKAQKPRTPRKPKAVEQQPLAVPAEPAIPRPQGRPSLYSEEIAAVICARLAEGKTLSSICRADSNLPSASTVLGWALDDTHPFFERYARARLIGYHVMGDSLIDDASSPTDETGNRIGDDPTIIARSRLVVDTKKWFLSKCLPKIYGDKLAITDADGGAFKVKFVE